MFSILIFVLLFASSYLTAAALISTYHFLPQKNFNHRQIKFLIRYTEPMRTGNTWQRLAFWGAPVIVLMFLHLLVGVLMLVGTFCAVVFSKRYNTYLESLPSLKNVHNSEPYVVGMRDNAGTHVATNYYGDDRQRK